MCVRVCIYIYMYIYYVKSLQTSSVRSDAVEWGSNYAISVNKPGAFALILTRNAASSFKKNLKISTALRDVTSQKNLHYRRKKRKSHIILFYSIAYVLEWSFYNMYCQPKKYLIDCQNLRFEVEE